MTRLINEWAGFQLAPPLRRVIYADFPAVLDPGDRAYFRSTRERDLGMSLEAACAEPEKKLATFQRVCVPLERSLSSQPYICGSSPAYADYIVFSVFQWARLGSLKDIVANDYARTAGADGCPIDVPLAANDEVAHLVVVAKLKSSGHATVFSAPARPG